MALLTHVASPDRWPDIEALFGERGACGGCWCMVWRHPRKVFDAGKGLTNKDLLKELVHGDRPPGVLGYHGKNPVGWCAVAPRTEYGFLSRSRVLAPVDDKPVWSVSCLFIEKKHRRQGLSVDMLKAAVALAVEYGATTVEGYPIDPATDRSPDAFVWTGLLTAFLAAGFVEVARRSETRPIVRYVTG
ncbi:MAG: GNAT family N-acetyltransferase [Rhodothermales bacterium]|nr:GNAT family N-acetyltransferase [Rhodothermales bacterium]